CGLVGFDVGTRRVDQERRPALYRGDVRIVLVGRPVKASTTVAERELDLVCSWCSSGAAGVDLLQDRDCGRKLHTLGARSRDDFKTGRDLKIRDDSVLVFRRADSAQVAAVSLAAGVCRAVGG